MARAESHQARPEEAQEPSSSLPQGGSLTTCCGASACLTALDRLASLTTHTPRMVSLLVTNCRARAVAHRQGKKIRGLYVFMSESPVFSVKYKVAS